MRLRVNFSVYCRHHFSCGVTSEKISRKWKKKWLVVGRSDTALCIMASLNAILRLLSIDDGHAGHSAGNGSCLALFVYMCCVPSNNRRVISKQLVCFYAFGDGFYGFSVTDRTYNITHIHMFLCMYMLLGGIQTWTCTLYMHNAYGCRNRRRHTLFAPLDVCCYSGDSSAWQMIVDDCVRCDSARYMWRTFAGMIFAHISTENIDGVFW